jgi:hypothetical protein
VGDRGGRCMAEAAALGGPEAQAGPAPVVLSWPLTGCRPDSLADLCSPRALAELARVAGPAGGAAVLELGGHTLQALAGGGRGQLRLLQGYEPPAGLHSLTLRNGTLVLRAGWGVAIGSIQPFAVSLERVKITRPAPSGSAGASSRAALGPGGGTISMVAFSGAMSGRMVQCRVDLSPAGPAGNSFLQVAVGISAQVRNGTPGGGWAGGACRAAGRRGGVTGGGAARPSLHHEPREHREQCEPRVGICAQEGARVVLEDVDVVARQGAGRSRAVACMATTGARLELDRCARGHGILPSTTANPPVLKMGVECGAFGALRTYLAPDTSHDKHA